MELATVFANFIIIFSPLLDIVSYQPPCRFAGTQPLRNPSQGNRHRPYTILVEGNVGSGKSTLVNYFANRSDIDIVFEPVSKWQNISGSNLLELMFSDTKRWSGTFQFYSMLTRYQNDVKFTDKQIRIMERSIYSGRYCFLESLKDSNGISNPEYLVMAKWFSVMMEQLEDQLKPDLILYVRCDIDVLMARIQKRGRIEEAGITKEFLERLNRKHEDWLVYQNSSFPVPAPVKILDGNLPLAKFLKYLKRNEHEILKGAYQG